MSTNTTASVRKLSPEDEALVTQYYEGESTTDGKDMTVVARFKIQNILSALAKNPDYPSRKDLEEELQIVRAGNMSKRM